VVPGGAALTRVVQFTRLPQEGQHSIERVFASVRAHLPARFEVETVVARHPSRGTWSRAATVLQAHRLDAPLVHVTGDITFAALAGTGGATVLTVHDVEFLERASAAKKLLYRSLWLQLPLRRAAAVTVPSLATAERLAGVLHADPAGFDVIANPVGEEFTPTPLPRSALPTLLLVGTAPNKNLRRVALALAGVACRVEVVGTLEASDRAAFARAGVDLSALGSVADADLPAVYARADALVFASTHEGFGMPILEAQASGRPVVTSDLSPLREVAGGAAILVDPTEPAAIRAGVLAALGDGRVDLDALVSAGRANAARYHPEQVAARYAEVYDRVLAGVTGSPATRGGRRDVRPRTGDAKRHAARVGPPLPGAHPRPAPGVAPPSPGGSEGGRTTRRLLSVQPAADGGGSEIGLLRMIRQLADAGWECHVALPHHPRLAESYEAAGALVHVVPMRRLTTTGGRGHWLRYVAAWPVSVGRLVALGRALDVDAVHTNSLHSWYGWAAAGVLGRPHLWHAREIVVQSGAALAVERLLTRYFSTAVVATSAAAAAALGRPDAWVVLDEPEEGEYSPSRAGRFRAAASLPDSAPLVGSVARIDTWKGFDVLLDAVPLLRAAVPDIEVVVAGAPVGGKDAYAAGLAERAGRLGVRWLGHRDDVADLLADLDVFVQVSTEPEPLGLVHIEALASGVPIVAGDRGGPAEILAGAVPGAGRLVVAGDAAALADAVLELLPAADGSSASRRLRPVLRPSSAPHYAALLDHVLDSAAASARRFPARRRPRRRGTPPATLAAPNARSWTGR
jgi:glycosyltransferase involved in cell wall biosynthesis